MARIVSCPGIRLGNRDGRLYHSLDLHARGRCPAEFLTSGFARSSLPVVEYFAIAETSSARQKVLRSAARVKKKVRFGL
jgi:hypothetical protein